MAFTITVCLFFVSDPKNNELYYPFLPWLGKPHPQALVGVARG